MSWWSYVLCSFSIQTCISTIPSFKKQAAFFCWVILKSSSVKVPNVMLDLVVEIAMPSDIELVAFLESWEGYFSKLPNFLTKTPFRTLIYKSFNLNFLLKNGIFAIKWNTQSFLRLATGWVSGKQWNCTHPVHGVHANLSHGRRVGNFLFNKCHS